MRCPTCPVTTGECLGDTGPDAFGFLCRFAESGDPVKVAHVVNRSAASSGPARLPPLLTRAANFAGAAVAHVAAGLPQASPELKAARLAVCGGCDQYLASGACALCGCNMAVKAGWAEQRCPLGKWPDG